MIKHPKVSEQTFKKSLWLIIALQLIDLLTTATFLSLGLQEGNPLFKNITENNFIIMVVLKIIVTVLIVYFLISVYRGRWWSKTELKQSHSWKNIDYALNFIIIVGLYISTHNIVGIILFKIGLIY